MTKGGKFGDTRINGLTGKECNYYNLTHPTNLTCVNDSAPHGPSKYDPDHGYKATTERIYGCWWKNKQSIYKTNNPCLNHTSNIAIPNMQGFVQSALHTGNDGEIIMDGSNEMRMHATENLPILTTLTKEFALFENFYSSVPGPTDPNRLYIHTGTSAGCIDTGKCGKQKQKSIYKLLQEHGYEYKYYFENDSHG